jgi:uncharacterized protein YoxC
MSLTPQDLQQIGNLIDQKLDSKLKPIQKGIDKLDDGLSQLSVDVSNISKNQEALIHQVNRMDSGAI